MRAKGRDTRTTKERKEQMLEALRTAFGVVTLAASKAGISRDIHYKWMRADKRYAEAVEEIQSEYCTDMVEGKLFQLINECNPTAIIFYLKTRGKHRGYIERQELTGAEGRELNPEVKVTIVDGKAEE